MIFSLLAVRNVSLEFHTVSPPPPPPPPSRTMAMLVRDARQNVFDVDEVRHVERERRKCAVGAQCSFTSVFSGDYICYP